MVSSCGAKYICVSRIRKLENSLRTFGELALGTGYRVQGTGHRVFCCAVPPPVPYTEYLQITATSE
jgi:hypothetical protein